MRIAVLAEDPAIEARVAATPEIVKKYRALGADLVVQAGAGARAGHPQRNTTAPQPVADQRPRRPG